jgi:putative addiction module component (TIGR02574 family)
MTKSAIRKSLQRLPIADRLELLEEIQLSLPDDESSIPLYEWQKKLLNKRQAEYRKNPGNTISGSEFQAILKTTARRLRQTARKKSR